MSKKHKDAQFPDNLDTMAGESEFQDDLKAGSGESESNDDDLKATGEPKTRRASKALTIAQIVEREKAKAELQDRIQALQPWEHLLLTSSTAPADVAFYKREFARISPALEGTFDIHQTPEGVSVLRRP